MYPKNSARVKKRVKIVRIRKVSCGGDIDEIIWHTVYLFWSRDTSYQRVSDHSFGP